MVRAFNNISGNKGFNMSKYKVTWGWYDGERNGEEYDNIDDAYESFHECTMGDHDWAFMYKFNKDGTLKVLHEYDKITESERRYFEYLSH